MKLLSTCAFASLVLACSPLIVLCPDLESPNAAAAILTLEAQLLKRDAEAQRKAAEKANQPIEQQVPPRSAVVPEGFAGIQSSTAGGLPPDTSGAVGPNHIVEIVQSALAIFNRATGEKISEVPLSTFFADVKTSDCNDETVVSYDDLAGRFVVGSLDIPERCGFEPE